MMRDLTLMGAPERATRHLAVVLIVAVLAGACGSGSSSGGGFDRS
jgi:hypothetical protein